MDTRTAVFRYTELKGRSLVAVRKSGPQFFLDISSFDPDTGDPQPAQSVPLDKATIQGIKTSLQAQVTNLTQLIADLQAL